MLNDFLLKNNFVSAIPGFYSGHGLAVQIISPGQTIIRESKGLGYGILYDGDHAGAIEYLSEVLDL